MKGIGKVYGGFKPPLRRPSYTVPRGSSRGWVQERRHNLVKNRIEAASQKDEEDRTAEGAFDSDELKQNFLLKYVQEVQPQVMEQFTAQASPQVVEAMKHTISNMLGTLPTKYFDVTISTVGENLAQLMYSVMMTGYMFRNAQYRMDVTNTLALPPPSTEGMDLDDEEYAEGSQQIGISGEILRWHFENGPEYVDAIEYIEMLEKELHTLKEQVAMHEKSNESETQNYLLEYLKSLEPSNIKEMTTTAGDEVLEAMNAFIKRLVGTDYDSDELKGVESKNTSVEMARLLYWLLIVGYSLRSIEVRMQIESNFKQELSTGKNVSELPSSYKDDIEDEDDIEDDEYIGEN